MDENTFSALPLIALVAVIAPLLSEAIRGRIPSVVIEIALGIVIGPYALELAKVTPVVEALSVAGLTFLFFMAGYEIDMRRIRGRPLRLAAWGTSTCRRGDLRLEAIPLLTRIVSLAA